MKCKSGLVAEFIGPQKVYTFSFIVGNIIPKSVKCIHSATKVGFGVFLLLQGWRRVRMFWGSSALQCFRI